MKIKPIISTQPYKIQIYHQRKNPNFGSFYATYISIAELLGYPSAEELLSQDSFSAQNKPQINKKATD